LFCDTFGLDWADMAKGSQLAQLKSALNQAGLTGKPQANGKKRKRSAPLDSQQKDKRAAKLEEIHRKLNPFDTKTTKLKHEVLGRKLKGVSGKPAQTKQAGLESVCIMLCYTVHEP
jgi:nucleolar protein 14